MNERSEINEALRHGRSVAEELVGKTVDEATDRIVREGHRPVVLPSDQEAVTADLSPYRIRLFVDSNKVVVEATAG